MKPDDKARLEWLPSLVAEIDRKYSSTEGPLAFAIRIIDEQAAALGHTRIEASERFGLYDVRIAALETQLAEERAKRETADRVTATLSDALVSACNRAKQAELDRDAAHIRNYEEQDEASALAASLQRRADKAERELAEAQENMRRYMNGRVAETNRAKKAERELAEERIAHAKTQIASIKDDIAEGQRIDAALTEACTEEHAKQAEWRSRARVAEARVAELEEQLRQYSALASGLVARTRRDR